MRKEETILRELERMDKSQYRQFYAEKAGVLLWVLGKAATPTDGAKKFNEQSHDHSR